GLLLRFDGRHEERVRLNISSPGGAGGYMTSRRFGGRPYYGVSPVGLATPTEPLVLVSARVGEGFKLPEPPGAGVPGMGGMPGGPPGAGMAPEPPPGAGPMPPGAAPAGPEPPGAGGAPPGAMPGMGGPPGG